MEALIVLHAQVDELRQELAAARAESASRQAAPAAPLASAGSVGGGAAGVQELQREKQGLEDEVRVSDRMEERNITWTHTIL